MGITQSIHRKMNCVILLLLFSIQVKGNEVLVWKSDSQYFNENKEQIDFTYSFINVNSIRAVSLIGKPTSEMVNKFESITIDAISGAGKAGAKGALASVIVGLGIDKGLSVLNAYLKTPQYLANEVASVSMSDGIKALNENYELYKKGLDKLSKSEKRIFRENHVRVEILGEAKMLYQKSKADQNKTIENELAFNVIGKLEDLFAKSSHLSNAILMIKVIEIFDDSNLFLIHYEPFQYYTQRLDYIVLKNYTAMKQVKTLDDIGMIVLSKLQSKNNHFDEICSLNIKKYEYLYNVGEGLFFDIGVKPDKNKWMERAAKDATKYKNGCLKDIEKILNSFKRGKIDVTLFRYMKHESSKENSNGKISHISGSNKFYYTQENGVELIIIIKNLMKIKDNWHIAETLNTIQVNYKSKNYKLRYNGLLSDNDDNELIIAPDNISNIGPLDAVGIKFLEYLQSRNETFLSFCGLNRNLYEYIYENALDLIAPGREKPEKRNWMNQVDNEVLKQQEKCKRKSNKLREALNKYNVDVASFKYKKTKPAYKESNGKVAYLDGGTIFYYSNDDSVELRIVSSDIIQIKNQWHMPKAFKSPELDYNGKIYRYRSDGTFEDSNGNELTSGGQFTKISDGGNILGLEWGDSIEEIQRKGVKLTPLGDDRDLAIDKKIREFKTSQLPKHIYTINNYTHEDLLRINYYEMYVHDDYGLIWISGFTDLLGDYNSPYNGANKAYKAIYDKLKTSFKPENDYKRTISDGDKKYGYQTNYDMSNTVHYGLVVSYENYLGGNLIRITFTSDKWMKIIMDYRKKQGS